MICLALFLLKVSSLFLLHHCHLLVGLAWRAGAIGCTPIKQCWPGCQNATNVRAKPNTKNLLTPNKYNICLFFSSGNPVFSKRDTTKGKMLFNDRSLALWRLLWFKTETDQHSCLLLKIWTSKVHFFEPNKTPPLLPHAVLTPHLLLLAFTVFSLSPDV